MKAYLLSLPFLLLCYAQLLAEQNSNLSIRKARTTIQVKKNPGLLEAYIHVWNHYQYKNQQDSFNHYIHDGIQYFSDKNMHSEHITALTYKARNISITDDKLKATKIFKEALDQAIRYQPSLITTVCAKLALNYRSRNELDSATHYAYKALTSSTNLREEVKAKTVLADVEMDAGLWEESKDNLLFILGQNSVLNPIEEYITLGNLVTVYAQLKEYEKYAASFLRLKEMQESFGDPSTAFHADSYFYSDLPLREQEEFLRNSLIAFTTLGYHVEIGNTKLALAQNLVKQKKTEELLRNFDLWKVEEDSTIKLTHRYELLSIYSELLSASGEFRRAHQVRGFQMMIKDSMDLYHNEEVIQELNTKYEAAVKDKEIQEQKAEIRERTIQRNIFISGLFLSLLIGTLFLWGLKIRNRKNAEMAIQKAELREEKITTLEQEKKLLSMSSILEGQENERLRIAKELHDGLGGLLTNVKAHFEKIHSEIEHVEGMDIYSKANHMIDKAYDEVRRISHNLMPSDLRAGGLPIAVRQLVHELKTLHETETEFDLIGFTDVRLSQKLELTVYRVTQELINNIVKHADASEVFIQLSKFDAEVQIVVEDNGRGFEYQQAMLENGLGLRSILSRVEQQKGHIDINSAPGKGTSVTVNIPF